jgi:hypothetical protein
MSGYDLPPELQVDADGPVRVVRLNRRTPVGSAVYSRAARALFMSSVAITIFTPSKMV